MQAVERHLVRAFRSLALSPNEVRYQQERNVRNHPPAIHECSLGYPFEAHGHRRTLPICNVSMSLRRPLAASDSTRYSHILPLLSAKFFGCQLPWNMALSPRRATGTQRSFQFILRG